MQNNSKKFNTKFIFVFLGATLIIASLALYLIQEKYTEHTQPTFQIGNPVPYPNGPYQEAPPFVATPINDGSYGLFIRIVEDGNEPDDKIQITYQDDGLVESGEYKGYHKIVASRMFSGPGSYGPDAFIFVTKDYQTFLFGSSTDSWSPSDIFNKKKVVGAAKGISIDFPESISLGNFVLLKEYIQKIPQGAPLLTRDKDGLELYGDPASRADSAGYFYPGDSDMVKSSLFTKYIDGTTLVYAKNKFGVSFAYGLTSKEEYDRQNAEKARNPDYFFYRPGVAYVRGDFSGESKNYDKYSALTPHACGMTNETFILKNIDEKDLRKVGMTASGANVFALGDANDDLIQEEYHVKIENTGKAYFSEVNPGKPIPTYTEYKSKAPVLVIKDPWGRWIGLGEFEYLLNGGCGKPVIYLYPEKPTEVSVKLSVPAKFSHDIPSYVENVGWHVLAHSDGSLLDLQKEKTNCKAINYQTFGLEYAKDACKTGMYPYLYWSGDVDHDYPRIKEGFVVSKADLQNTMTAKLKEIGLNTKEISDMEEYWIPEMEKKDAPYYRISFFDTVIMNSFIPMQITPKPDTMIRVFLDWNPLDKLISIKPQEIRHIDRKGFTLVEWGGLKQ